MGESLHQPRRPGGRWADHEAVRQRVQTIATGEAGELAANLSSLWIGRHLLILLVGLLSA